jgi:hypothetical protein
MSKKLAGDMKKAVAEYKKIDLEDRLGITELRQRVDVMNYRLTQFFSTKQIELDEDGKSDQGSGRQSETGRFEDRFNRYRRYVERVPRSLDRIESGPGGIRHEELKPTRSGWPRTTK